MSHRIIIADVLDGLRQLDDESVQCIVTSPPYWNLRNYGTATWEGGDANCDHLTGRVSRTFTGASNKQLTNKGAQANETRGVCPKCGAVSVDRQIGLEPTISEYVEKMRDVFRECKRVLRNDGTLWLNLGDSYAGTGAATDACFRGKQGTNKGTFGQKAKTSTEVKQKDLCGIPWRVAFALQDDGYYLRKDIIWAKPNPMPESVRDRPTSAHEYIFLLTKSASYFYDSDAIAEPALYAGDNRGERTDSRRGTEMNSMNGSTGETKNARSVWTIATEPYSGSHYAVFPSELPRRCILAGTSAAGACAACGSAYERVLDVTRGERDDSTRDPDKAAARIGMAAVPEKGWESTRLTTGWKPTCNCNAETVPCTVLDPFAGSGTTIQVAIELGRNVIGIDLDARNKQLIEQRILATTPPLEGIA